MKVPGWLAYELDVMLIESNRVRARLGFSPIDRPTLERAERLASGSTDYTSRPKFALHCCEIALGENQNPADLLTAS